MVHLDQHIVFDGSFYSVPQIYVNQTVMVRATEKIVQILFEDQLIKTHPKALRKGQWVTDELDYPEEARKFLKKMRNTV